MEEEKPKKKSKKEKFTVTLDDGSIIDIDDFDWGKDKYTQKEKLFMFWYTFPDSNCFHDKCRSTRKAGYSQKTASQAAWRMLHNEKIVRGIKLLNSKFVKTNIEEAYNQIIKRKISRANFVGTDFYKSELCETKYGDVYTKVDIKPFDELTEEQKNCIDGIDFVGKIGIPNYKLPNRTAEENKIIEIYEKMNGTQQDESFDVETTAEIIKGNLSLSTKIIKANNKLANKANFKEDSEGLPEQD